MESGYQFNSLTFITDGGPVSMMVALLLVTMSVASWYLIIVKSYQAVTLRNNSNAFTKRFWDAPTLASALNQTAGTTPVSRLATQSIEAAEHHQKHAAKRLADACNQDEFVARAMRRNIADESAALESGLTVLASVGSVSPFIGLFGTVWGIYHALASISLSGQATLDKVAGPVGEALIMTAMGLAVAIPAVLAYNALVRSNRVLLGQLESFAHDLHTLLIMGTALTVAPNTSSGNQASKQSAAHLKEVNA
ncbi:MotA/TolQ/ExbB proton channel family protein [Methyloradius palustris]|uniref:Biopolymer transport protein ExbB n=1 Tax=Methyloradius palustris TaxID=2778876 RepID=A0A8D5JWY0_9PROT|nr:MotA/TolQ/ExbB proton channel family protein [Methyloradius palustris]BCM25574.1 MotA/TolQ/ExbB proton channel family protein [Methyloradius palustris]